MMDFEEVIRGKQSLDYTEYMHEASRPMKVYVVPNLYKDFEMYLSYFRMKMVSDESAKLFSSDGQYMLCGIWFDGVTLIYHRGLQGFIGINKKNLL